MQNEAADLRKNSAKAPSGMVSPWAAPILLSFCIIPFGWSGLIAPVIWIFLRAIEFSSGWPRALSFLIVALLMLVSGLNLLPGSEPIQVLPPYSDSSGNLIYASINSGKAVIAIALLAFMLRMKPTFRFTDLPYLSLAILAPIACGLLLYAPSLKLSGTIAIAAIINLLIVCISEEGFFRWVLQRGMEEFLGRWRWLSVPVIATVFVLLHGGWSTDISAILLLMLASIGYALLWTLRQNFWICVMAHWGVNLLHMLLLPYPLPG
ncbi:CPBP family intramembrane glutamic endopeptidase [Microbulbifer sp. SSSA002]|uniref:lysostaphin resistance A-like protein n=1 Tax=Microbulbifer sp. SSSA002 TaxID=3243376 RepID=UPI004039A341